MIPAGPLATLLLLVATPVVAAQPRAESGAIVAVADAFDRAQLAQDAATLDRMVADDLVFIDGSGARRDKTAFIAGWTGKGDRYEPIVLIDRTFTRLGARAWIVGAEVTLKGVSNGRPFANRFRFADTFRKVEDRWRAVHIQVTRIT